MANREHANPFDDVRRVLKSTIEATLEQNRTWARSMRPYNSEAPTREERLLIWNNPHLMYPDEVDPTTGMPLTNAQAAQKWADEDTKGFIEWAEETDRLERRYAREGAADAAPMDNTNGTAVADGTDVTNAMPMEVPN